MAYVSVLWAHVSLGFQDNNVNLLKSSYTRLMQDGKAWRDTKYPDITIWRSSRDGMYKFKAHAVNTQAIKEDIKGSDTIAYLRRFLDYDYSGAVIALSQY